MKINHRAKVYVCFLGVMLLFIWGNSLLPGELSGELSSGLMVYIGRLFAVFGAAGEFVLRKLAHFSEYTALGFFLGGFFTALGQPGLHRYTLPLGCGLFAACVDETIQVFAVARGSSLIDVWIDFAGVCCGLVIHEVLHRVRIS